MLVRGHRGRIEDRCLEVVSATVAERIHALKGERLWAIVLSMS